MSLFKSSFLYPNGILRLFNSSSASLYVIPAMLAAFWREISPLAYDSKAFFIRYVLSLSKIEHLIDMESMVIYKVVSQY